ncbi:MAG: hypothetical protein OYG32_15230, partial [Rhodospirillaceae bacterium]|nr:hypothetical protein [Rhodospirillaceae bacterium]
MNRPLNPVILSGVAARTMRHAAIAIAAAILAAMVMPAGSRAETPAAAPPDRDAVRKIVREYLLEHPEVIEEAIRILQARQQFR